MINAEDVQVWLADPITKKFFEAVADRIEHCKEVVIAQAGLDPLTDSYYRGYAIACRDILNTEFEGETFDE